MIDYQHFSPKQPKTPYFYVFESKREFVSKNASFEEDFVSFLLIVSRIFLPPVGGLEGGFIFAFLSAGEILFENTRVFQAIFSASRGN